MTRRTDCWLLGLTLTAFGCDRNEEKDDCDPGFEEVDGVCLLEGCPTLSEAQSALEGPALVVRTPGFEDFGDNEFAELRGALEAAEPGDTVLIEAGRYLDQDPSNPEFLGGELARAALRGVTVTGQCTAGVVLELGETQRIRYEGSGGAVLSDVTVIGGQGIEIDAAGSMRLDRIHVAGQSDRAAIASLGRLTLEAVTLGVAPGEVVDPDGTGVALAGRPGGGRRRGLGHRPHHRQRAAVRRPRHDG